MCGEEGKWSLCAQNLSLCEEWDVESEISRITQNSICPLLWRGSKSRLSWEKKFNKARFINKEKEGKKSHITWFIVILFMYSKAVVFKVFKFNALRSPRSSFFNRMYLHKSSITVWRMRWENAFYSFFYNIGGRGKHFASKKSSQ